MDSDDADRYFGHPGFAGSRHPLAVPDADPAFGPGRYVLEVVYRDGNPRELERFDYPREALAAEELERAAHLADGHRIDTFCLRTIDEENPERGALSWDDID